MIQLSGRLEIGRSFAFNSVTVTPFAAVQAAQLWQDAYTETSTAGGLPGLLALSYAAHTVSSLPTFLGTKFDGRYETGNGMVWMPFVRGTLPSKFLSGVPIRSFDDLVPAPVLPTPQAPCASLKCL